MLEIARRWKLLEQKQPLEQNEEDRFDRTLWLDDSIIKVMFDWWVATIYHVWLVIQVLWLIVSNVRGWTIRELWNTLNESD